MAIKEKLADKRIQLSPKDSKRLWQKLSAVDVSPERRLQLQEAAKQRLHIISWVKK
ncbi:hypothetical protein [Suttonella indologenes]|uniref:Uncharacterized protein n=1 Tax=Suttonella indologenes TaxID=13276 RepID=A0A380MM52_9GAMM|nr:hypothetical protein [Suttonella indologenes]SUO91521.1 Uncharacterised protein [Suttonella indologenes]